MLIFVDLLISTIKFIMVHLMLIKPHHKNLEIKPCVYATTIFLFSFPLALTVQSNNPLNIIHFFQNIISAHLWISCCRFFYLLENGDRGMGVFGVFLFFVCFFGGGWFWYMITKLTRNERKPPPFFGYSWWQMRKWLYEWRKILIMYTLLNMNRAIMESIFSWPVPCTTWIIVDSKLCLFTVWIFLITELFSWKSSSK